MCEENGNPGHRAISSSVRRWHCPFRDFATLATLACLGLFALSTRDPVPAQYPARCLHAHRQPRSTPALCSKPEWANVSSRAAGVRKVRSWRSATACRLHGGELSLSRQASSQAAQRTSGARKQGLNAGLQHLQEAGYLRSVSFS